MIQCNRIFYDDHTAVCGPSVCWCEAGSLKHGRAEAASSAAVEGRLEGSGFVTTQCCHSSIYTKTRYVIRMLKSNKSCTLHFSKCLGAPVQNKHNAMSQPLWILVAFNWKFQSSKSVIRTIYSPWEVWNTCRAWCTRPSPGERPVGRFRQEDSNIWKVPWAPGSCWEGVWAL